MSRSGDIIRHYYLHQERFDFREINVGDMLSLFISSWFIQFPRTTDTKWYTCFRVTWPIKTSVFPQFRPIAPACYVFLSNFLSYMYIYILLNCRTWDGRPPFEQLKEILVGWFIGGMKNYARLVRMITVHSGDSYQPSTVHGCKKGGSKPVAHLNHCHLGYINATWHL